MIKEYIGQGESLEEATNAAIEGLGADVDADVQIEVISEYKKKTLGLFGGSLAKVRAYIELPDPKPAKKAPKKADKKPVKVEKAEKKAETAPQKVEEKVEEVPVELNLIPSEQLDPASCSGKAANYIKTVLLGLGCENVTVQAAEIDGGTYLQLDGDKLGVVIGRRGETLDALQYLTSLAANTGNGYYKVTLNIGNYREKREKTLKELAKKVSAQVLSSGRSRTLEPMNPYERRIIHTVIQEIEGVTSNSVGEGSGRRVVVSPEGAERHGGGRGRGGRGGRGRGDRKPSQTVNVSPDAGREPKKDSPDIPLYGRLN
ncbi:MAG: KH domain-containing protein [Clostridia bacterium]|nr:KH domain-containing protein [Clostridia bacterium]